MDLEDFGRGWLRDETDVDSRRGTPVEPLRDGRCVPVVAGATHGDCVAARWRRERIHSGPVRYRVQGRVDSVRVDERDGCQIDEWGDRATRAHDARDLTCRPGGQGEESPDSDREHEEDRESADCPVSAQMHSGFSSLARSRSVPPWRNSFEGPENAAN